MADKNQQGKICTGDCFACSYQQAWMCTSQHALRALNTVNEMAKEIQALRQEVDEMRARFAEVPTPPIQVEASDPEPEEIAQKPSGAENRLAKQSKQ